MLLFKSTFSNKSLPFDIIFFSTLLVLIPLALISGPAIPDIFLSLIAFYFLCISFSQKLWKYYKNPIVLGFLFFSLYGILRSFFSQMPLESLTNEGSIFYFRYIFFSMGVWYLLEKNPKLSRYLMISSFLCILIISLDGLYQYFIGNNIIGFSKLGDYRLTGFFGDEPIIGRYIAYLAIFTFALVYENFEKTKKTIILLVSFLVFAEVLVFLSGERAAFLYLNLFAFLILIFIPKYRAYRLIGFFMTIIIISGITQFKPASKERMIDHTIHQVSQAKYSFLPFSKNHEELFISGIKMFKQNPLFGIGTNTYRFHSKKPQFSSTIDDLNSHPHNYYIQSLAELGIIGFLFLLSFFLYLVFIGSRQLIYILLNKKNNLIPFEILIYPMILFVYWWPIIPHMSLYNNWNNVLLMLPLGFFLRSFYAYKNN